MIWRSIVAQREEFFALAFSLKDAFWTSTIAKMTLTQVESMLAEMQDSPEIWLEGSGIDPRADRIHIA
ncbi:hypothetical protein [Serratia plymuthica]|uniref:hypothetical protein n=1 Tax=Serratia TaxID=613 RepID=UPI0002A3001A|nr:hypothetical protein [Serratia plymuthica]EKF63626.1 alpha/beta hydrolase fold domain protein [Serratia plymuthica A30]